MDYVWLPGYWKKKKKWKCSRSIVLTTVALHAPLSMEFSRQDTGVGSHSFLQGTFLTQGSNLGLPHCRQVLYRWSHQRSLCFKGVVIFQKLFWPGSGQRTQRLCVWKALSDVWDAINRVVCLTALEFRAGPRCLEALSSGGSFPSPTPSPESVELWIY